MLHCEECEYFSRGTGGQPVLRCDPFRNIKEPECLTKHQLLRLDAIAQSHQATLDMHRRLAPLQEKMMRHVEREIDDVEEADRWKYGDDDVSCDDHDDDDPFRI